MIHFDFYKSLYDRELQRRFDLDNALNIPIGLVAILIASASFVVVNINECDLPSLYWVVLSLTAAAVVCIIIAVILLALSYNNLFLGFKYSNFEKSTEWLAYQRKIDLHNQEHPDDKMDFESEIINKLAVYTDSHSEINNKRQKRLRDAKSFIVASLLILLAALIIVALKKYLI